LVVILASEGLSPNQIATFVGISLNATLQVIQAFNERGMESLDLANSVPAAPAEEPLPVLPKKPPPDLKQFWLKNPPASLKQAASDLEYLTGKRRSLSSISTLLRKLGLTTPQTQKFAEEIAPYREKLRQYWLTNPPKNQFAAMRDVRNLTGIKRSLALIQPLLEEFGIKYLPRKAQFGLQEDKLQEYWQSQPPVTLQQAGRDIARISGRNVGVSIIKSLLIRLGISLPQPKVFDPPGPGTQERRRMLLPFYDRLRDYWRENPPLTIQHANQDLKDITGFQRSNSGLRNLLDELGIERNHIAGLRRKQLPPRVQTPETPPANREKPPPEARE
jgi:transposase